MLRVFIVDDSSLIRERLVVMPEEVAGVEVGGDAALDPTPL